MADMTAEQLRAAVRVALFDSGIEFNDADEALLLPFFEAGMRSHGPLIEHITMPVHEFMPALRALAARLSGMAAVPDGWKLVPVRPTNAMQDEGADAARTEHGRHNCSSIGWGHAELVYHAMLAAAPEVPGHG